MGIATPAELRAEISQSTEITKTSQLPPEKLEQIRLINEKFPLQLSLAGATEQERAAIFANRRARLEYLAQYLTPEELRQYPTRPRF
ncbi:MAG: hypothetical protein QM813_07240 [Verrucomicrobiota bacterium]